MVRDILGMRNRTSVIAMITIESIAGLKSNSSFSFLLYKLTED